MNVVNESQAPAPAERVTVRREPSKRCLWGEIAVIGLVLVGLVVPFVIRTKERASSTRAMSSARQLEMALFDFAAEYGSLPSDVTAEQVKSNTGSDWKLSGENSNDYFRQLIAAGITQSEGMFHEKGPSSREPDGVMASGSDVLGAGECGYAYFPGADLNLKNGRPVFAAPMIPGTLKFDRDALRGKAVIFRSGVTAIYPITRDGSVIVGGKNLFDPGQPFWNGTAPVVKWPK